MFKNLSKSTWIMFLFDLVILTISSIFWCNYFSLSAKLSALSVCLITITGLITLFLKGNYKIREFNITFWNAYRLFESIVFAHVPFVLLVFLFVSKMFLLKFTLLTELSQFILYFKYSSKL